MVAETKDHLCQSNWQTTVHKSTGIQLQFFAMVRTKGLKRARNGGVRQVMPNFRALYLDETRLEVQIVVIRTVTVI